MWSPTSDDIPDARVEEYITLAREKYGYTVEQALGMLFWHKNDLEKAAMDLANFTPLRDQWTREDRILFEQAFHFHGKCFHRIRQMLPDKSIADLVRYYYTWKKSRNRLSVMDRQEQHKKEGATGEAAELAHFDESEVEEKVRICDSWSLTHELIWLYAVKNVNIDIPYVRVLILCGAKEMAHSWNPTSESFTKSAIDRHWQLC